jgi:hypothetical protein
VTGSPAISFVIPVRNDAVRLGRCLEAIRANRTPARIDVIVADNGSDDDSADVAASAGAAVVSVPGASVAHLRNVAAASTAGALVAFVDADHLIDSGWVSSALAVFSDRNIAAAGAPYSASAEANWVQRAYDRFRPMTIGQRDAEWLGSGNLIVRREVFESIQGFDATLEACEDVDLCNRLRAVGHRLVTDERLGSVHLGDPATLRALFFGELWRGRDNMRVTLRGPLTWRALPSLIVPVVGLLCLGAALGALWFGAWLGAIAAVTFVALAALRAARMTWARRPSGPIDFVRCLAVAAVYDLARALALVVRGTHRTRRETAGESPRA